MRLSRERDVLLSASQELEGPPFARLFWGDEKGREKSEKSLDNVVTGRRGDRIEGGVLGIEYRASGRRRGMPAAHCRIACFIGCFPSRDRNIHRLSLCTFVNRMCAWLVFLLYFFRRFLGTVFEK